MIEVHTPRLVIRDPLPADLEGWHRLKSDTENMRFVPDLQTHSLEESRADLQRAVVAAQASPRRIWFFSIISAETGAFLGSLGFQTEPLPEGGLLARLGWFLLPEAQGRGYASEALRALLPHMFGEWGVTLADASCYTANKASERVMQKAGMTRVKTYGKPWRRRAQYQLTKKEYTIT